MQKVFAKHGHDAACLPWDPGRKRPAPARRQAAARLGPWACERPARALLCGKPLPRPFALLPEAAAAPCSSAGAAPVLAPKR